MYCTRSVRTSPLAQLLRLFSKQATRKLQFLKLKSMEEMLKDRISERELKGDLAAGLLLCKSD